MADFITAIQAIALAAGFWGLFSIAFLQEIIPPIPSTVVAMSAGFFLFAGEAMDGEKIVSLAVQVGIPIALGLTIGSIIVYCVVAWGGKAIIERYGSYIGVAWSDIEKLQQRMTGSRVDDTLLFVARAFPLVPSVAINILAGLVRWKFIPFVLLTFFGTIVRATWSALIGWQVGNAFEEYADIIEKAHFLIVLAVGVAVVIFVVYRRTKQKASLKKNEVDGPLESGV